MQEDMHYYGTYALARAAGLPIKEAKIIAYSAQYVDDSTATDSEVHEDGGMFETIATAHTNGEAVANFVADHTEQRKVWVPFHFFPGGDGDNLSEKLKCVKDGHLAQEMVRNHMEHAVAVKNEYGNALIGVMAHVYADTFSHYDFSGVSSRGNKVDGDSFQLEVKDEAVKAYIMGKFSGFVAKYAPSFLIKNYRNFASKGASVATGALGHGAVGTYPDRPFLKWRFIFKKDNRDSGWRDNRINFMEACEQLHALFCDYGDKIGKVEKRNEFSKIKHEIQKIIDLESNKEGRIEAWRYAIRSSKLFQAQSNEALNYSPYIWNQQKDDFEDFDKSVEILKTDVYRFHQAAIYHRDYTLKHLLPKHGILVI